MKILSSAILAIATLSLAACNVREETSLAGDWAVQPSASRLSFVTIKAGETVEAHRLSDIAGSVSKEGDAKITIGLASVDTGVEVRDVRMRDFLFETAAYPAATVTAKLDPALFAELKLGESMTQVLDAQLDLHGVQAAITAEVAVTRIGPDKVQVETTRPVIVDAAAFNLRDGLEKLRELANLPSITDQVPVSFSIVLSR